MESDDDNNTGQDREIDTTTNDDDNNNNDSTGGYVPFAGRQARAILYKLAPMSDAVRAEMTAYVHDGHMQKDLRFVREVYGKTNTSGKRDFLDYWESPWVEEHIRETPKKRRMDTMQKASAVRNYSRNASAQEGQDVDKFMSTMDKLWDWEAQIKETEDVKTVSRLVQSFERVAVRSVQAAIEGGGWASAYGNARALMGQLQQSSVSADKHDVTSAICHTMRRSDAMFDLFASVVASEMMWTDATSGTRNTTSIMCQQIRDIKDGSIRIFVRALNDVSDLQLDTVAIPLMNISCNMCVSSNGILIMGKDSVDAVYVLDMQNSFNAQGRLDLTQVKTIHISESYTETDETNLRQARQKEKDKQAEASERRRTRSAGGLANAF